jgi:hypothetical protein
MIFEIVRRVRTNPTQVVSCNDFVLRRLDSDQDVCAMVARMPNLTPYCLSHRNQLMIFAETPLEIDLSAAPFYYQRQFETATRLVALPYEQVHRIAADCAVSFEKLVLIYSVGRCGSTLMSRMWHQLPDTHSLSEPDVLSEISQLHITHRIDEVNAQKLSASTIRLLHRPHADRKRLVIKFRSHCIRSAELIHRQFPMATLLFMYRNGLDSVDSYIRVFGDVPLSKAGFPFAELEFEAYKELGRLARPTMNWIVGTRQYMEMRKRGLPFIALKYEFLLKQPHNSTALLFGHCGVDESLVEAACAAMAVDSQAGSQLRKKEEYEPSMTPEESLRLLSFFGDHSEIASDAILRGTIDPTTLADAP